MVNVVYLNYECDLSLALTEYKQCCYLVMRTYETSKHMAFDSKIVLPVLNGPSLFKGLITEWHCESVVF